LANIGIFYSKDVVTEKTSLLKQGNWVVKEVEIPFWRGSWELLLRLWIIIFLAPWMGLPFDTDVHNLSFELGLLLLKTVTIVPLSHHIFIHLFLFGNSFWCEGCLWLYLPIL
jgi:hypothetical protein